jgi:hypothetical protein
LGKLFFGIAILIGVYMFFCQISNILIHVDEYWTLSLINLPFIEGMRVAISDVHPPLHYIILYAVSPITHNNIFLLKVVSIVPYFIILAISATKIRKDYGWLTSGVFAFTIATMSIFFIEFLTVRMYPWALLFMILVFIYFKEVLVNFDKRSWILLTLFTLLGAYTHYFLLFTCGLVYLLILASILKSPDKKEKIKTWIYSVVSLMILYAPWFAVLIRQIGTQTSASHEPTLLNNVFSYVTIFAINSGNFSFEMMLLRALAIIFLVIVLVLIYKNKAKYEASGVFLMYATIIIGVAVLAVSFQPVRARYLMPVIGIFWLSVSILLGKIENNKILAILLALILVFSASSILITHDEAISKIEWANERNDFLDSINNDSTVMVYNTNFGYMFIHGGVNKTTEYSLSDTYFFDDNVKISKDLDKILDKHPKDNVYLVNWKNTDKNKKYEKNFNLTKKYDSGDVEILKIGK